MGTVIQYKQRDHEDRHQFIGASYRTQQQVNRRVAAAIVAYRHEESARLAHEMPPKDITLTQDETFTGGLCTVEQNQRKAEAAKLAEVFQRSSSNVEGHNGYLSLRNHQLRGLDHPRKRACQTLEPLSVPES